MSSERLPPAEIEAIKERVNNALEDAEGEFLALQKWLTDWRIRQAALRKAARQDASPCA